MDREQIIQRGVNAQYLLESEPYQSVHEILLNETFGEFIATDTDDEMLRVWAVGQALGMIQRRLNNWVDEAKLEQANQKEDDERRKRNDY